MSGRFSGFFSLARAGRAGSVAITSRSTRKIVRAGIATRITAKTFSRNVQARGSFSLQPSPTNAAIRRADSRVVTVLVHAGKSWTTQNSLRYSSAQATSSGARPIVQKPTTRRVASRPPRWTSRNRIEKTTHATADAPSATSIGSVSS